MIDSHCHLADDAFAGDVGEVIARATAVGVQGALCILDAATPAELARAAGLAPRWPGLRFAVGIHPHQAGPWAGRAADAVAAVERALASVPGARAVGEIGLDYHYDFAPREAQRELFVAQAELARDRGLPVVVHAREADDDALAVIAQVGQGRLRAVMHCFTGDEAFARRALALGCYISLAGIVTFPRAESLRVVARMVPADRLLVETDSPYLAPVPHRGKRNEPAFVVRVAERLAEVCGVAPAALAEQTTRNYEALFRP
jgi:TatD DNase family protein